MMKSKNGPPRCSRLGLLLPILAKVTMLKHLLLVNLWWWKIQWMLIQRFRVQCPHPNPSWNGSDVGVVAVVKVTMELESMCGMIKNSWKRTIEAETFMISRGFWKNHQPQNQTRVSLRLLSVVHLATLYLLKKRGLGACLPSVVAGLNVMSFSVIAVPTKKPMTLRRVVAGGRMRHLQRQRFVLFLVMITLEATTKHHLDGFAGRPVSQIGQQPMPSTSKIL
mmetsp:Transcript_37407/g.112104  ORF Transcript_37407/g.112104 Transcript_37407/m.112104 type:complete len:222 (-) Transcript_37407:1027-1692(-)